MTKILKSKIIVVIICISFCQGLQYTVSPVLNQIQDHFSNIPRSMVQMLITMPALLAMVLALLSGWMVKIISKKKMLVFGSFITGMTGFLPLLADSFPLLLFSRVFFGVGLGFLTALNTAVVAEFFKGKERVSVMGIQAASIGTGMLLETTLSGILGRFGFQYTYGVHIIGILAMILIALLLPDTGKAKETKNEKIRLNKEVIKISVLGLVEFLFMMTFTTNIAMHLSGSLAGDSSVSGLLTGVFSGAQIVIGLILGYATRYLKKYTLASAMISFGIGAIILVLFPSNVVMLVIGAIFCGFSQGMFVPQAMVEVSNAVSPVAAAMASACFTCGMCIGQVLSPTILNSVSNLIFGKVSTTNVYMIAAGATITIGIAVMISKAMRSKKVR